MIVYFRILAIGIILITLGCSGEETGQEMKAVKADDFSQIIRSPVNYDGSIDTLNVAKMTFREETFNFDTVTEGERVIHDFDFINTGTVGLLITEAQSTCGCTVPEYPKEIIQPGEGGTIHVEFASQGRIHKQDKPITITANTYPSRTVIRLKGFVNPAKEKN